jgi:ornithine cyclodeaminase/alanine dehydrogenase-like protein (mu-crystallin family)
MNDSLLWITEQEVASLVLLDDAIVALEKTIGSPGAFNVPKALGGYGDGSSMHSLGSAAPGLGFAGYKNWVHTKRGATAVYSLFDADSGRLLAVLEAAALGQLRTSAMTGLGTRWLAPPGADDMALVGTGTQALTQIAAVNAVRPLKRLRIYSPTPERRRAFAEKVRGRFALEVIEASSVEQATEHASIVTLITRGKEPFLSAAMLAPGTHLNAVGAILPANAEFEQDIFERAGIIVVDDLPNTQRASREFIDRFGPVNAPGEGGETAQDRWSRVKVLGRLIAEQDGRPAGCDLSLFKAMGMGLSDLAVAMMVYQRAGEQGIGQRITQPVRATPSWKGDPGA